MSSSFDNWMTLYIYTGQPQHLYSIQIPLGLGAKFDLESLLFSYFWWYSALFNYTAVNLVSSQEWYHLAFWEGFNG